MTALAWFLLGFGATLYWLGLMVGACSVAAALSKKTGTAVKFSVSWWPVVVAIVSLIVWGIVR